MRRWLFLHDFFGGVEYERTQDIKSFKTQLVGYDYVVASHEYLDAFNETTFVGRKVIALRVSELEQLCKSNGNSRFALMLTILVAVTR